MDSLPLFADLPPLRGASAARALYRPGADVASMPVPVPVPVPVPAPARPELRPESLHPSLWLGHQLARHAEAAVPTGFAALDAQLPGAGWPRRALSEVLLPHPGVGEIRLLAPSLVATQKAGRLVMLFDPPADLSAVAFERLGFAVEDLLIIHTRARVVPGSDSLWALEQALKSGHVGAVLAWLPPRLRAERLRRLQLAAHAHDGPAFVLCEMSAAQRPTAAPLRLALRPAAADVLSVRVLKRRGPLLERPLLLELPPVRPLTTPRQAPAHADATAHATAGAPARSGLSAATFVNLAVG
ncbi:translesion DNA synthesis-associated protein ImuA [Rhizobacter fulvus]